MDIIINTALGFVALLMLAAALFWSFFILMTFAMVYKENPKKFVKSVTIAVVIIILSYITGTLITQ